MSNRVFAAVAFAIALAIAAGSQLIPNEYFFSAAYTVLLFVILATAWNILGGYTGYVNFGSAAFFAIGAYTTVVLYNAFQAPLLVTILGGDRRRRPRGARARLSHAAAARGVLRHRLARTRGGAV